MIDPPPLMAGTDQSSWNHPGICGVSRRLQRSTGIFPQSAPHIGLRHILVNMFCKTYLPEYERGDHENGIEGESSREEHRRRRLALDHMDADIERRREQGLPGRGDCERAGEQENEKSCDGPENGDIVQNEGDRPP